MEFSLSETDKDFISQLLDILESKREVKALQFESRKIIKYFDEKSVNGAIRSLTCQLECNLNIFESETLSFKDLRPELSENEKRLSIIVAFKEALKGNLNFENTYETYIKYVIYNSDKIEVTEIYRENFGFILFKAVNSNEYYLDVMKNHSFAYWSELARITPSDAEELLKNSSYQNSLIILSKNKNRN